MTRPWAIVLAVGFVAASHVAAAGPYQTLPLTAAGAAPSENSPVRAAPKPSDPYAIAQAGIVQLRTYLGQNPRRDAQLIEAFLETTIAPYFDFETMGRWAAGPFYRKLLPGQRVHFHAKIRSLFLSALARNLGSYGAALPSVRVLPPVARRWGNEMIVRAQVALPHTYPVTVDFRFYRRGSQWRIFDVAANGFSAVTYYRRHFAQAVRARGIAALTN